MEDTKRHIYVHLLGRIGNNLFQVAAGASLAKRYYAKLYVIAHNHALSDPTHCVAKYLSQFEKTILRNITISWEYPRNVILYKEPYFHYTPIPFYDNLLLCGYFQSEKYFDTSLISELFNIDEITKQQLLKKYGELLNKGVTGINVRRGDYLRLQELHPVCSLDYFQQAMHIIGEKEHFIVISDDIDWCKIHFKGENIHFTYDSTPIEDLYLQALCQNNIISNSTFSWWGAWLNKCSTKRVIAPLNWFGSKNAHLNTKDLLPESWIKI